MRRLALVAGAVAGVLVAAPAFGQASSVMNGKAFQVTPYTGYMMFGNFVEGPLGTSLSASGGMLYGAQLGLRLAPGLAVVGNVGYSRGDLRVGIPFLGGLSVGESRALLADGGLQLDIPMSSSRVAPFVQAGVGAIRYDIDVASVVRTRATNLAGNVGLGLDIPLGRTAGLRVMAKDYIGKFDLKDATGLDLKGKTAHNWALTGGVRIDF